MTTYAERPTVTANAPLPTPKGKSFVKWITSTDHKTIGYLYLMTSFAWFLIGGVLALALRAELARPGMQFLSNEQYNQIFTMHGTIMLLMFATPLFVGFANVIMPLQIGAADVAFPRMNMLSYWLFLFGGLMAFAGFLTPGGAASFGPGRWGVADPGEAVHRCLPGGTGRSGQPSGGGDRSPAHLVAESIGGAVPGRVGGAHQPGAGCAASLGGNWSGGGRRQSVSRWPGTAPLGCPGCGPVAGWMNGSLFREWLGAGSWLLNAPWAGFYA